MSVCYVMHVVCCHCYCWHLFCWKRLGNLVQCMDLYVLWCHKENCGQDAAVQFRNGDGKDWKPGQDACEGVDNSQDWVTQQQPQESAETTLQRHKMEQFNTIKILEKWLNPLTFSPSALRFSLEEEVELGSQLGAGRTPGAAHSLCPQPDLYHHALVE